MLTTTSEKFSARRADLQAEPGRPGQAASYTVNHLRRFLRAREGWTEGRSDRRSNLHGFTGQSRCERLVHVAWLRHVWRRRGNRSREHLRLPCRLPSRRNRQPGAGCRIRRESTLRMWPSRSFRRATRTSPSRSSLPKASSRDYVKKTRPEYEEAGRIGILDHR